MNVRTPYRRLKTEIANHGCSHTLALGNAAENRGLWQCKVRVRVFEVFTRTYTKKTVSIVEEKAT